MTDASSEDSGSLDEDEALGMLELHSQIHNARSAGALCLGFALGLTLGISVPDIPNQWLAIAAILIGATGAVFVFLLPRVILWSLRNSPGDPS